MNEIPVEKKDGNTASAETDVMGGASEMVLSQLGAHIRSLVREYTDSKSLVMQELDTCRRQARSEYSDSEIKNYEATGIGCTDYQPLTEGKINVAQAMIFDVVYQASERTWMIEPTPIPDLDEDTVQNIAAAGEQHFQELMAEGLVPHTTDMAQFGKDMETEMRMAINKEAKKKAERMQKIMDDQLAEGGFWDAVNHTSKDFCTYPAAFMRAVLRQERVARFIDGELTEEDKPILQWERVSPFNVYPSRNNKKLDHDSLFMKVSFSRAELFALADTEGYSRKKVIKALSDYGDSGLVERDPTLQDNVESDRYDPIDKQETGAITAGVIDGFEYWGNNSVKSLRSWGMKGIPKDAEDTAEYAIHAILIGDYIIFAQLNTNPLQRKLFYSASYEDDPDSVWGGSLPKKIRSAQRGMNSTRRAMITNLALASGPQVTVDDDIMDATCDTSDIFPLKVWHWRSGDNRSSNSKPVDFFQPSSNIQELIPAMNRFAQESDEYSGIPRYTQGNSEGANIGAAKTATGLSMLMNAQSKTFKKVIANFDTGFIKKSLEDLYYRNMKDPAIDDEAKGDMRIVTKGILGMSLHEQLQLRRQEFLQMVLSNETLLGTIGQGGLVKLLREVVKTLDMQGEMILPNDSQLEQIKEQAELQDAMQGVFGMLELSVQQGIISEDQFRGIAQLISSGGQEIQNQAPRQPQAPIEASAQPPVNIPSKEVM